MFLLQRRSSKIKVTACCCFSIMHQELPFKKYKQNPLTSPSRTASNHRHCNKALSSYARQSDYKYCLTWRFHYNSRTFITDVKVLNAKEKNTDNVKEKETSKWMTVPNMLTMFRMSVSPYIGYLVLCEQFYWAFGLVFLAGLTDMIDGWIARNFEGQCSIIGSYIDPLADKIMISILTLSLTVVNIIPVYLCGLIVARDVLIVAASSHFHYKHLKPPKTVENFFNFENSKVKMEPTLISKFNTFLQLGLVGMSVAAPVFNLIEHPLLHAYWYLVGSTTVMSGLSYVIKDKSAYMVK